MSLKGWADRVMGSRPPDFVVGSADDPYLKRWWILPRNRFFNIYLHRFLRSDTDEALHDHMYVNLSVLIEGCYREHFSGGRSALRVPGDFIFRRARTPHRVELCHGIPVTSLFVTGPRIRQWGFYCPKGWIPWTEFVESSSGGNKRGKGCS